jgi:hypothetical protein
MASDGFDGGDRNVSHPRAPRRPRRGGLTVTPPLPVELSFTTFSLSFAIGYKF